MTLHTIREQVQLRVDAIRAADPEWPCCKGCDECCRRLASSPRVNAPEWRCIAAALDALPSDTAQALRQRILNSAGQSGPVVCPLLDGESGTCTIYDARPVACRTYGFYAERDRVLGCGRIAAQSADVVWGNHATVEDSLDALGPAAELSYWLTASGVPGQEDLPFPQNSAP